MKEEIKKQIQENMEGKSLASVAKQIRKETRKKVRLEKEAGKQKGVEKQETEEYIQLVQDKIKILLEGITAEKIKSSNLASVSKAFRSLLGNLPSMPEDDKGPEKSVSVNFNISNMSNEEIIELLNKKSSGQDG